MQIQTDNAPAPFASYSGSYLQMTFRTHPAIISCMLVGVLGCSVLSSPCQQAASPAAKLPPTPALTPTFEVATIKPLGPSGGKMGLYTYPGGRVFLGASTLKMMIYFAYGVPMSQISGGPDWVDKERYDINAIPPDDSPTRTAPQSSVQFRPTDEQRKMLQNLLTQRFGLKLHHESKEESVLFLEATGKPLQLEVPKDPTAAGRGGLVIKSGAALDGEAFGTNISMAQFAEALGRVMQQILIDKTGLSGTYDFHVAPASQPFEDVNDAVFSVVARLGLRLRKGRAPIETIVIDSVSKPTEN
jgi:uncharacterized protein (TIGR03435 family)